MPLTDTAIKNAKPGEKHIKLFDGGGLYLEVSPAGGKWWRLKYRFRGKEKRISLGVYPAVSLKEARNRRDSAKTLIASGVDPGEHKKESKAKEEAKAKEQAMTFEVVGREWHEKRTVNLSPGYRQRVLFRLEKQIFPFIGGKHIAALEPLDILAVARRAEKRGAIAVAHMLVRLMGQVCRYARVAGYAKFDAAAGLSEALLPVRTTHFATITDPKEVGNLLRNINDFQGELSVMYALRIMPYVFVRSTEMRCARWEEINLESAEWIIPAGRMKMKRPHIVPLSKQVVALLTELLEYSGNGQLLFPGRFSVTKQISESTLLKALRRIGYTPQEMTIHGFRSMASTILNEQGYRSDVIEAQLAHSDSNTVRAAYNHAVYLDERRKMMQEWADYLDSLRENGKARKNV